jgi:ribonuclease P protein component
MDGWSSSAEEQRAEKTCLYALLQNNSVAGGTVPAEHTYPPTARLRKRPEFLRLKDSARKFASRGILVVWQDNGLAHARLGVTVSKKVGCAVIRNRVKRCVREVFRNNRLLLPAVDLNVIARSEAATMDFHGLQQELLKAFRHIGVAQCSKESHS